VVEIDKKQVPQKFTTWTPIAIAKIKDLPGTLQHRSIAIRLRRKLPSDKIASFRGDRVDHLTKLCRKAARWARDNMDRLREMDALTPEQLHGRAFLQKKTALQRVKKGGFPMLAPGIRDGGAN
jgi:Protein of unknown function (DUF3631)